MQNSPYVEFVTKFDGTANPSSPFGVNIYLAVGEGYKVYGPVDLSTLEKLSDACRDAAKEWRSKLSK